MLSTFYWMVFCELMETWKRWEQEKKKIQKDLTMTWEKEKKIRVALYQALIFHKCEVHKLKNKVWHWCRLTVVHERFYPTSMSSAIQCKGSNEVH